MKKLLLTLVLLASCFLCFNSKSYASMKLNSNTFKLTVGENKTVKVLKSKKQMGYFYIGKKKIRFVSSNSKIASVNSRTGKITGKKPGKAKIKIMLNRKIKKTCNIIVNAPKEMTISNKKSTWVVSKDGSGDFTTVTEAANYAKEGDTVYIKNGVYEDETIRGWGKTLYLIGESRENTIIRNGRNTYNDPPIEFSSGTIENLTVYSYDSGNPSRDSRGWLSYAIHIDNNYQFNRTIEITNCNILCDRNAAVGIGLRKGNLTFNNCYFESRDHFAIYMHDTINGAKYGAGQYFTMINCTARTKKLEYVARFDSEMTDGSTVYLKFVNNKFLSDATNDPKISVLNIDSVSHGTCTRVGTFMGLINFFYNSGCYGNNIPVLNN